MTAATKHRLSLASIWLMAVLYVGAGINHFWHVEFYRPLMPPWIPAHETMIALSGVIEIALGLAVLSPRRRTRQFACYAIIAMLVVFLNVHVYMWIDRATTFQQIPTWILFARLPLQFVLIGWAYSNVSGNSSTRIGSP